METNLIKNAKQWLKLANDHINAGELKQAMSDVMLAAKWIDIAGKGNILSARQYAEIGDIIDTCA